MLVHVLAGLIFLHPRTETATETVATSQRIVFERKRVPKPKPTPTPIVHVEPTVVIPPLPLPLPLARIRPHPERAKRPAPIAHLPERRKELAKLIPHAPIAAPNVRPTLSDARIAQITSDLRADIANDVARRPSALAVAPAAIATPRHYALDASSFLSGDRTHHGLCDPIKNWEQDGFNYYFVSCNVRFSDGTYQRQPVPWPVRFPPGNDPFAGTANGEKPLAMPLPGWHLPAGESVSVELRAYARDHGVTLDGG